MLSFIPPGTPKLTLAEVKALLELHGVKDQVIVVGIRGYYNKGQNQRGIYDDAVFVVSPTALMTFNANTDPSAYRKGKGKGAGKGMASLKPGHYHAHNLGLHKGKYLALIQTGGPVTVVRDGNPPYDDVGHFGINIHKGGVTGTSSLGCQTIYPGQWKSFIDLVQSEMKHHALKTMPYLLVEA